MNPSTHRNTDPIAAQLASLISRVLVEEARKAQRSRVMGGDAEIMRAAGAVGQALDALQQAKFTGREPAARVALEKMAAKLQRAMKKHGRMP